MIAALFVDPKGCYVGLPNVDPWDEKRDARLYAGPHSVVAHPPCTRWCRLAGLVEARWGHKRGEDGGCFASALAAVRTYGGVLEHPAYSAAWPHFGIAKPPRHGGWVPAGDGIGFTCHVEQCRYGHRAKKATWLYAVRCELPELLWGSSLDTKSEALVSWCGNRTSRFDKRPRLTAREARSTPVAFRDVLLSMALTARPGTR